MNSLPQPASGPERRQALETFGILAVLRLDRSCSEDEVAQKLGFGSVEARRIQLKHSGVPECMLDEAAANERSAVGEDRAHVVRPTCPLCGHMPAYAAGRWPERTPAPAIVYRSRRIWVLASVSMV